MRRFLILVALLTITGSHAADVPTVLIFGDSLSAGYGIEADQSWATLLQSRLREQGYEHRVVNASISGETTEGGAERIGPALDNFSPELIILELGGNDGLRGFPPARIVTRRHSKAYSARQPNRSISPGSSSSWMA
jgi:acyl-CoA thioesterase-1